MASSRTRGIVAALAATFALVACGGTPRAAGRTSPGPDAARHPYTEADVRFMSGMITHHAQAIVMAGWALTHDSGPSVRRLAERIVNAQQDEIATMRQWLRDRQLSVPEEGAAGTTMRMNGVDHQMLMPGTLTEAQMRELEQAQGPEFDRLFLAYMIQHPRGAMAMVEELFGSYGAARDETVFKFANDVNVDQTTEIERMKTMLAATQ